MSSKSLFIVVEGLDGSGKTEISRRLVRILERTAKYKDRVKLTFEPHDPSCAGVYIRHVLMRRIKKFSPKTLALAFSANRLDHCDREINPFLDQASNRIVVCDRYYLSSLVYQTNNQISMNEVMSYNNQARRPDLILFLNVSNRVCFERMKKRAESKELFEKNLTQTREKYYEAIDYLRRERQEKIVEVDANGDVDEVLENVLGALAENLSGKLVIHPHLFGDHVTDYFALGNGAQAEIKTIANKMAKQYLDGKVDEPIEISLKNLDKLCRERVIKSDNNTLGSMFLSYLSYTGYSVHDRLAWSDLDAFELTYELPLQIKQQGIALFVDQSQRIDVILKKAMQTERSMSDFMFVFDPTNSHLVNEYFDREIIQRKDNSQGLLPNTKFVTKADVANLLLAEIIDTMFLTTPVMSDIEKEVVEAFVKEKRLFLRQRRRKADYESSNSQLSSEYETLPF